MRASAPADRRSPFLSTARPTARMRTGSRRIGAVAAAMGRDRRRKPSGVEAVVIEVDERGPGAARLAQMPGIDVGAGRHPGAGVELFALLPFGRRPDVLRMRRAAPGETAQEGGVAGHRGRRVQEMRVQLDDVARQLGGQHERLPQAANPACASDRAGSRATTPRSRPGIPEGGAHRATRARRAAARGADIRAGRRPAPGSRRGSDGLRGRWDGAARRARDRRRALRARGVPAR